jgi:hypothetical protein
VPNPLLNLRAAIHRLQGDVAERMIEEVKLMRPTTYAKHACAFATRPGQRGSIGAMSLNTSSIPLLDTLCLLRRLKDSTSFGIALDGRIVGSAHRANGRLRRRATRKDI